MIFAWPPSSSEVLGAPGALPKPVASRRGFHLAHSAQLRRTIAATFLLAMMFAPLTACQRVLFPHDEPRTQYEAFDRMRNRDVPTEKPDVFGRPQPALRERLTPPT